MKRIALAFLIAAFVVGSASAQTCATKAMSKDGKPLAGAAKTSFVKKCCEESAVAGRQTAVWCGKEQPCDKMYEGPHRTCAVRA